MPLRVSIAPVALALLSLAFPARGQQPASVDFSANVLSSQVALGEIGQIIYKITGGDAEMPQSINVPGLDVMHSGKQSSISILNGIRTIETTHFYRFRGSEPGEYTIPPITITIGQTPLTSRALTVTLFERDQNTSLDATRPYFAKLELPKTEFYVNEIVPFTLTAYVRGRNMIQDIVQPKFEHEIFVIKAFRDVRTDAEEIGGTYFSSAVLPSTLFSLKPGQHRLGPADIGVRVRDEGSGSFGLPSFFNRTVLREIASNTVNVTVKELPNGAPLTFNGGVGSFEFVAKPSTTSVAIGDPISMEFTITGKGNLRTMSAPVFVTPQTGIWKTYEASKTFDDESASDGYEAGTAVFSQVIIPEAKVDSIPSFAFSYFDPSTESYVTRTSEPIPIEVAADNRAGAAPVVRPTSEPLADPGFSAAAPPTARYDDVLHIRTATPRWIASADLTSRSAWFYLVHTLFSAAFCSLIAYAAFRWWKERSITMNSDEPVQSYREALRRLPKQGASRRDYYRAVARALALWKKEHGHAPSQLSEVVDRVTRKCESVLYSGSTDPDTAISPREVSEFQSIFQKLPKK